MSSVSKWDCQMILEDNDGIPGCSCRSISWSGGGGGCSGGEKEGVGQTW